MHESNLNLQALQRVFSAAEWDWLVKDPHFAAALEKLLTLEDMEHALRVGLELISSGHGECR